MTCIIAIERGAEGGGGGLQEGPNADRKNRHKKPIKNSFTVSVKYQIL